MASALFDAAFVPLPASGDRDDQHLVVPEHRRGDGLADGAVGGRHLPVQGGDGPADLLAAEVLAGHDHLGRHRAAGEGLRDVDQGVTTGTLGGSGG